MTNMQDFTFLSGDGKTYLHGISWLPEGKPVAHGVAHEHHGHIGKLLPEAVVEGIDVVHHRLPGVAGAEIHRGVALLHALAVAQVVVAHHDDAVTVEEPGKIVITGLLWYDGYNSNNQYITGRTELP